MNIKIKASFLAIVLVLAFSSLIFPDEENRVPLMDHKFYEEILFPGYEDWNALWDIHASGPFVYVPLCTELAFTASARLFQYDTRTGKKRMILDPDQAAGIDLSTGIMPQSKFHTAIRTMKDGRLFMVSHNTASGRYHPVWALWNLWHDPTGFSSHAFIYDPHKDTVIYLGTPVPHDDLYYGQLDKEWNLYYACGMRRKSLYMIDLNDFTATELGNHPCWITIVVDDDHMVYTSDEKQRIWKWDPVNKKSTKTGLRMPHSPYMEEAEGSWVYGWKDKDGWIYAVPQYCNRFCRFKPNEGIMEDLGNSWEDDPEAPGRPRIYAPVRALNGKIYYGFTNGRKHGEGTQIIELDPETKKKRNLGTMQLSDGTFARGLGEGALGADGKIYWGDTNHAMRGAMMWAFDPSKIPDNYKPERTVVVRTGEQILAKARPVPEFEATPSAKAESKLWRFFPLPGKLKKIEFITDYSLKEGKVESLPLGEEIYPLFDNAVYGMSLPSGGWIYGIAGGEKYHLFRISEIDFKIEDLGIIQAKQKMINGNVIVSTEKAVYFAGDHIYTWTPEKGIKAFMPMAEKEKPVALAVDRVASYLYVLTEPANKLLVLNMEDGKIIRDYQLEGYVVSRWLVPAKNGGVYGFENNGWVYTVNREGKMKRLKGHIPSLRGLEFIAEVTSVATEEDGKVWGGTRQGYLFSIDPEREKIINHGKPGTYYLKGVSVLPDGVYSFGGGDFGDTHLYRYREGEGFEDLGLITKKLVNAAVRGKDGKLYGGEYSSSSSVFRFTPLL
jgi:outer membrane protein assembly factor BamB